MKIKATRENALRSRFLALAMLSVAALLPASGHAQAPPGAQAAPSAQTAPSAQAPLSAEEARFIEFGKEIFKSKAVCQYCHKWDASGDQGYGGNALSLRVTQLTPEQMTEVVKCGRPATGMPYHDRFAYTDKRCYGYTREQMDKDMPPAGNDFLSNREVDAVVKYLFAKDVGRGPATYQDCVDFWGTETKQCEPMKK
jgi:cytochrome c5